ncbi:MAG: hydrolase [Acidimicrobiales bacterium]|nr:hydrolase [Acidimicrobiales bacterium]
MAIHLIRHAKAGSRQRWDQPDEKRPLSTAGAAQAEQVAEQLSGSGVTMLVASPALRCRQTLEPLGRRLGREVAVDAALAEGASGEGALEALMAMAATSPELAACSHGDVIPRVLELLARQGVDVEGGTNLPKGGRVTLDLRGGTVVRARAHPAPAG